MIKFDKLEEIYKDKKANAIVLMANIFAFTLDVAMFIIYIVGGNLFGVALTGVFVGLLTFAIIMLVITQVSINKAYKEEQAKIELETFLESQKILMGALQGLETIKNRIKEAQEKGKQDKAEAEKPKAKKKAEPKKA